MIAEDGQYIDEQWAADGGKATLKLTIDVAPLVIVDAFIPPPDAYIPSFDEIKGDDIGCDSTGAPTAPVTIILLATLFVLPWVRRRHD